MNRNHRQQLQGLRFRGQLGEQPTTFFVDQFGTPIGANGFACLATVYAS